MNVFLEMIGTLHSVPSSSSSTEQSDRWVQQEFEIAKLNAEKNRSLSSISHSVSSSSCSTEQSDFLMQQEFELAKLNAEKNRSLSSVPLGSSLNEQSERWIQQEFAIAEQNAEKNRSIEVLDGHDVPTSRASYVDKKTGMPKNAISSAFEFSSANFNEAKFRRAAEIKEGDATEPDFVGSIHHILGECVTAVKSLFNLNQHLMNQDNRLLL